jgi:Ribosomal protein L9, C-terminal domain
VFGSVTALDIAEAMAAQGQQVDRRGLHGVPLTHYAVQYAAIVRDQALLRRLAIETRARGEFQ